MSSDLDLRRLRRQLHDGLGQSLALALIQTSQVTPLPGPGTDALRRTQALLRQAVQELRALCNGLADPGIPSDLTGRLMSCVQQLNAQQTVPIHCTMEGSASLSTSVCNVLIDATRELLVNACKHGPVICVDVRLQMLPHRLNITVTQHGGSPTGTGAADLPVQGLGLQAVRQTLDTIGARLRWRRDASPCVQARISWIPSP